MSERGINDRFMSTTLAGLHVFIDLSQGMGMRAQASLVYCLEAAAQAAAGGEVVSPFAGESAGGRGCAAGRACWRWSAGS